MSIRKLTVLITGANRGIGLELVRQYLAEGWQVYGCCRQPDTADGLKALTVDPALHVHPVDVSDRQSVKNLSAILAEIPIDLLINNAGVNGGDRQAFGDLDYGEWARVLDVNTLGPYRLSTQLADQVASSERRVIVNISSSMASIENYSSGGQYIYRSSKTALNMVTVNLAHDLRQRGITVLSMDPGWVRTDMGGPNADISPGKSVAGIRQVIENSTLKNSGCFVSWEGVPHPW